MVGGGGRGELPGSQSGGDPRHIRKPAARWTNSCIAENNAPRVRTRVGCGRNGLDADIGHDRQTGLESQNGALKALGLGGFRRHVEKPFCLASELAW